MSIFQKEKYLFKMDKEVMYIFANSFLLIAVYFWYDTLKMLLKNRMNPDNEFGSILISIIITAVAVYLICLYKPTAPVPPLPPASRNIDSPSLPSPSLPSPSFPSPSSTSSHPSSSKSTSEEKIFSKGK